MDEQKRIAEIKEGLKKSVYQEAARIQVEEIENQESTEKLSNILEGYMERIDTINADNMEELEEELRILKNQNVEVGSLEERDLLIKQYNDYIHNDLDRTIAETIEYTHNLNNHTDDLQDILTRPMAEEQIDDEYQIKKAETESSTEAHVDSEQRQEVSDDTDELFEIEATTDLGVLEDIVELEGDTLDIEETQSVETETKNDEKQMDLDEDSQAQEEVINEQVINEDSDDEFADEKKLAPLDYALIVVLIIIFAVLVGLVAKVQGVI